MPSNGTWLALLFAFALAPAHAASGQRDVCGEVISIATHAGTTTRYALAYPEPAAAQGARAALILLVGGEGYLKLDDAGCPQALVGNSLVRSIPHFHAAGFVTALVDAPSDHMGGDGLGAFRVAPGHAEDLGKVIAEVRARTKAPVWIIGTSRGAISAANAASRLTGAAAPDGVVLTSALMVGSSGAKRAWVAHSVFDLPLEAIKAPVLVVGHAEDTCIRSPAALMGKITARTSGAREQIVTVTGGPGPSGASGLDACAGRTPHGFLGQEAEVAAGIARFINGGTY